MRPTILLPLAMLSLWAGAAIGDSEAAWQAWSAHWISVPGAPAHDYGVYHFRRSFDLPSKPSSFKVHVTADQRYQLFVNGERVGLGPARGDLFHWRFETYDLAPWLKAGRNVIAAVVWNLGPEAPVAQHTNQTGFLLGAATPAEQIVETGKSWKCFRDQAYAPEPVTAEMLQNEYYAAGPGERVNAARYPWGWEKPDFDDSSWVAAADVEHAAGRFASDSNTYWMLVPRSIPMPEMKLERLERVRGASVMAPQGFPAVAGRVVVPANTKATILLDNGHLTTAYPELIVSGGAGAKVTVGYAEGLYIPGTHRKDNRNDVEGRKFYGYRDVFLTDGGARRLFRPLWWRTYRYMQITVETKAAQLTLDDIHGVYTGYPFERKARLEGVPQELQKILDTGWRTARLCAHETYMDCPYYEQLQYVGDTRIQAMVSIYMSGDGRLVRNAIELINSSRTAEGATFSRAPSRLQQYIPPFSLWWIGMVHDYWMYQDDPLFVREMLPGVRSVLSFFAAHQKANASLGCVPWWNFVDWAHEWKDGVPPIEPDGSSAPIDLQLLLAYDWASKMEVSLGSRGLAEEYAASAAELRAAIRNMYWDPGRRYYADTPRKQEFSQHTQALAILAGLVNGNEARDLITRTIADKSLTECTIYFRYYLYSALRAAGEGDRYLDLLDEWRAQLARGMTTWAESPEPSRSDCHAWGASPNIELFRTVLGVDAAAPGFRRVVIRPHLGKLETISGTMPHPKGEIAVRLAQKEGKVDARVTLPEGIEGEFVWKGHRAPLSPGANHVTF